MSWRDWLHRDFWKARWDESAARENHLAWRQFDTTTEVDLDSIARLEWRGNSPGGAVRLWRGEEQFNLNFEEFRRSDRLAMIRLLRDGIRDGRHEHWDEFCWRIALPLRQSFEPRRPLRSGDRLLTRWRWDVIFAMAILPTACVSWYAWRIMHHPGAIVIPLFLLAFWAALRFVCPQGGLVVPANSEPPGQNVCMWALFVSVLLGFPYAIVAALILRPIDRTNFFWVGLLCAGLLLVMFLPPLIVERLYRQRRKDWRERRLLESVNEWNEGEHMAKATTQGV